MGNTKIDCAFLFQEDFNLLWMDYL